MLRGNKCLPARATTKEGVVSCLFTSVVFLVKVFLVFVKLLDFGVTEEFINLCRQRIHVSILKDHWLLLGE